MAWPEQTSTFSVSIKARIIGWQISIGHDDILVHLYHLCQLTLQYGWPTEYFRPDYIIELWKHLESHISAGSYTPWHAVRWPFIITYRHVPYNAHNLTCRMGKLLTNITFYRVLKWFNQLVANYDFQIWYSFISCLKLYKYFSSLCIFSSILLKHRKTFVRKACESW